METQVRYTILNSHGAVTYLTGFYPDEDTAEATAFKMLGTECGDGGTVIGSEVLDNTGEAVSVFEF